MQLSAVGKGRVRMRISLIAGFVASIAAIVPNAKAGSSYDGPWTVNLFTKSGPCEPNYQFRGHISNGVASFAGANSTNFAGRVTPNGAVTVTVSGGGWLGSGSGATVHELGQRIMAGESREWILFRRMECAAGLR
jgi:hypothetical protein